MSRNPVDENNRKRRPLEGKYIPTVYARLMEICRKDDAGCAVYDEGWDDTKFAEHMGNELGITISYHSIATMRKDHVGNFRRAIPPHSRGNQKVEHDGDLGRWCHELEQKIDGLNQSHNLLTTQVQGLDQKDQRIRDLSERMLIMAKAMTKLVNENEQIGLAHNSLALRLIAAEDWLLKNFPNDFRVNRKPQSAHAVNKQVADLTADWDALPLVKAAPNGLKGSTALGSAIGIHEHKVMPKAWGDK